MFNFVLREFHDAHSYVAIMHYMTEGFVRDKVVELPEGLREEMIPRFEKIEALCRRIHMPLSIHRAECLLDRLRTGVMNGPYLRSDTKALSEAMEADFREVYCYSYPSDGVRRLERLEEDWGEITRAFPSADRDIVAAVDLLGLNHPTACIFHLMRAVEVALRALAKERGVELPKSKPIESAQWQEILSGLNAAIKDIGLKWKAGPKKATALEFYSSAVGHMTAFKDKYRNHVSHSGRVYDEHEAASALLHVHEFMRAVSERLKEGSKKPIKW